MQGPKENDETATGPSGSHIEHFSYLLGELSVKRFNAVVMTLITSSWT